jgi:recombination protein RecA
VPKKKTKRTATRNRAHEVAAEINSLMGKAVMTVASDPELKIVKIPTPSLTINRITGGGFALGRHVELYGDPSVGKSTIMYGTMALSQRRGNLCGLVDPEGVFDPEWYTHLGGYPDELLYSRPDNAEEIIGSLRLLVEKAAEGVPIEVVGVDSQSAMVTKEQVEKDPTEEERVASQARMMSRALRVLTMRNRKILFIWTNQLRSNIGFGSQFQPSVTTGGRAMGFYATTRIEFKKTGAFEINGKRSEKGELKAKKKKVGDWIQVKSMKEKAARPYEQGAYIFRSDKGRIDIGSEIIQLGLEDEIIEKVGNSYIYESFDGQTIKGTMATFSEKMMTDIELQDEIVSAIEDMTYQLARVEGDDEDGS